MLILDRNVRTPVRANFYFGPLRFRPILQAAYVADERPKVLKVDRKLDMMLDTRPGSRLTGEKSDEININNNSNLTADKSPYANNDEDSDDSKVGITTPKAKAKKKKSHKLKNGKTKLDQELEGLCPKLRVSFILAVLGGIIVVACCCALFLRNRIVKCWKNYWPRRKKKQNKNLFNVEEGEYPYQASRKFSKSKGNSRMIDTGTQDSQNAIRDEEEESKIVGCSPCCKKKKKKSGKKRRKY